MPPVTQALLLINVGIYCLQRLLGPQVDLWFGLWPPSSGNFMPWQPVTYAFLHGSLGHLGFNMLSLWMFGSEMERCWGPRRYLQYYGVAVLSAAAMQVIVALVFGGTNYVIGASGGIYGLLLAYGLTFPNRRMMLLIPPIPMSARTLVIVFVVMEVVFGYTGTLEGVAHFAHLGGMLGGWLLLRYWRGLPPFRGARRR